MSGEAIARAGVGWREVPLADLARHAPAFCQTPVGIAWSSDGARFGLCFDDVPSAPASAVGDAVRAALVAMPACFDLLVDARRLAFGHDSTRACAIHRLLDAGLAALSPRLRRYVLLASAGCALPWWHGVHLGAPLPEAWRVVTDPGEAARFVELGLDLADELAALAAVDAHRGRLARAVDEALVALQRAAKRPRRHDIDDVAAHLAMSVRSLQRALAREGVTFNRVRARWRERVAAELLERGVRVEEVALAVGFASASHFSVWFRARRGVAPGALRRRARSDARP